MPLAIKLSRNSQSWLSLALQSDQGNPLWSSGMAAILDSIPRTVHPLFSTTAEDLARPTGFVKRLRALTPAAFARTMSLFLLREPNASLAQLARELDILAS